MAQTRTNCPRCRQPLMADVEQLFDLDQDPEAKQKLLSGGVNVAACQNCGYQGMLPVPIIYHDSSKELLLTYFPPELMMPVNEQDIDTSCVPVIKLFPRFMCIINNTAARVSICRHIIHCQRRS